jgi:hypothetical protein
MSAEIKGGLFAPSLVLSFSEGDGQIQRFFLF